ncbi:MAG: integration host factor subunit beta [bacterium]|nr:integration host factor subunit beta [bacterium]
MTKADLVEKIAERATLSKKDSEIVVNTVFQCIIDSLAKGDKVELRGFGSFRTRDRRSRVGRNPKTGDRVDVPEKKVPFFKPGKNLKQLIND